MNKLRLFEAFAGYGSQALALGEVTEFVNVGISELETNKIALQAHEALHGKVKNYGDIKKINPNDLPDMDIFTYSFPCQDLSRNGKQAGLKGDRSGLLYECEKIIEHKKPKYLLLENVSDLVNKKNIEGFNNWLEYLKQQGYKTTWIKSKALSYGIPQNRERVFAVSSLIGKINIDCPNIDCPTVEEFLKDTEYDSPIESELVIKVNDRWAIKEAVVAGYSFINNGDFVNYSFPKSKTRRGRVGRGYCQTLLTSNTQGIFYDGKIYPIKGMQALKLMGLNDNELNKIKQLNLKEKDLHFLAGNSIVKNVLVEIFKSIVKYDSNLKDVAE